MFDHLHIRWLIRRDLPEVLEIEGFNKNPMTEAEILHILSKRNCIGMVIEKGETVVGFMIYELFKTRLVIRNLSIHPNYRRKGIGTQLAQKLISKLSTHRRSMLVVALDDDNLVGQLFFKKNGFMAMKVLGDLYIMEYITGPDFDDWAKPDKENWKPENRIAQFLEEVEDISDTQEIE